MTALLAILLVPWWLVSATGWGLLVLPQLVWRRVVRT